MDSMMSKDGARRDFLAGACKLGAGLALGGMAGIVRAASAGVTAPVALSAATLRVGMYKGGDSFYFDEAGVAATPYKTVKAEFAAGNLIVEAINGGSIDVGSMSEIPPIFAAAGTGPAPLKVVAVLRGDVNNQVILVPKASVIGDTAQLKGKRVGYVRSTTSHYFLLRVLKEQGLAFRDIVAVPLSPQDGLAAFQSGQLDAWVIYGLVQELAKQQGARVLRTADGILSGNYVFAAASAAIADPLRHAAIGDYLRRVARVYEWINQHPQQWANKSGQLAGVSPQLFLNDIKNRSQPYKLQAVDDTAIRSQQQVADVFADNGMLARRIDVTSLWDRSFAAYLSA
jgi:sulfonate transport system substrate-binding protein